MPELYDFFQLTADVGLGRVFCKQDVNVSSNGKHCSTARVADLDPSSLGQFTLSNQDAQVLSAFTQAAMLHLKGERVSPALVHRAVQLLQTPSPSALLLR
jgi:arginine decarboxylase